MTSRHGDPPTDGTCDRSAEIKLSQALEPATFEQLQTELDDFVIHTRLRLNSLSQSLTKYLSREPETYTESVSNASAVTSTDETIHSIVDQVVTNSADALLKETQTPTPGIAISSFDQPGEKIDSIDQFSAIKLRLAQQLKNSS